MLDGTDDYTVTCFPRDEMVDTLDSTININKSLNKVLSNYYEWVNLWKISIAITIITSEEFKKIYIDEDYSKFNCCSQLILTKSCSA